MNSPFKLEPAAWALLRRLLDEGLALAPAAREPWLAALPPEAQALKPRLRRLLDHAGDEATLERFDNLPQLAEASANATAAADTPLPIPPDAGPYRPIRLLGEGGMSSVWLAERTDVLLNRPVALKLPRATWRHSGLAQRMAQEREILGLLEHPHIARIYDAGVAADGQPYLALEYVEGQPIDAYCRAQALTVKQRVALFLQVAQAVAHAHAKLVVHRDLKPSNILVTPAGEARLLDFGIAKLVGEAQAGQPELTLNAARVMTPHYAAPEQILGKPISTATDIYALGVVLYELLTGERPCRPARHTAAALEEAILHAEPVAPSVAVADSKLSRTLRGDLDTIILKALKKAPEARYGTVTALADDLDNWLHDRPVRARPDSARYRTVKYLVRNRLAIGIVGVIVLSLTAGLAGALWQADRAQREAAKALAIKDYLVGLFESNDIDQVDGLRKRQQSVQQLLEQGAKTIGQGLGDQPEVRDELQRVVGRLLQELALTEPAIQLRKQRVRQLEAADAPAAQRVQALLDLGTSERAHGDLAAARITLGSGMRLCTSGGIVTTVACRVTQMELGRLDYAERHMDAALAQVEPAQQALSREAPRSIENAEALELLGILRAMQNQSDASYALFQQSISIKRELWGAQSVRLAMARYRLGRALWTMRHLARAESEFRSAWEIAQQALGPEHAYTARIELNLGRLTAYMGLRADAMGHILHAGEVIDRQAAQIDAPVVLEAQVTVGNGLLLDGRLAEAGTALRQALATRTRLQQPEAADPTLDQSYGRYLLDVGRFADARTWLVNLRERTAASYGRDHPDTAERSLRIASVWLAEGRLDEVQHEIDTVLASQDSREAVFGSVKHKALLARAALLLEQGRAGEAQPVIDAQIDAALRTPREDQYRDVLFQLYELSARSAAQLGQKQRATEHFGRAIALLEVADPRHPYLAVTRARFGLWLLAQGDPLAARRQIEMSQAALKAQPEMGEQFQKPLREAQQALARAG